VVVCGDTGSGKTTQLPKICLAAGFGRRGAIGHTQPRRIAARAVAARLAEEMGAEVGAAVGLKTRFTDRTRRNSVVKVMTDGILLNEIREDRWLKAYDALIIDEAHERSVNIDFLLGYLVRIREHRPDLRVIITSATMDTARLAAHFDDAPVLNIPGRSFPVDVLYRPPDPDSELPAAVVEAVRELAAMKLNGSGGTGHRDMLVFLPGERWIRDTREALLEARLPDFEVLPLYARLTAQRQDRIFKPGRAPRIVLATNVAETSLTVPRVRFVIDSGLARISRYSARHRSQGLAVEPIAQANAVQRAGRCGRLAPGVCIRLFAQEDFDRRPAFTDPEILRTNLASVLLRLEALGLGSVTEFPFLDPPPERSVNDAWRLLQMLGALDDRRRLTRRGRAMSRLPVDPRLARMLVAGREGGVLPEMLVMVAAMSVVDPRERPPEAAEAAQREQDKLADPRSDFVTFLNLWHAWQHERRRGRKAAREFCDSHFLSMARMREWEDVRSQLAELTRVLGWRHEERTTEPDARSLHVAVLTAFADRVARLGDRREYHGARDTRATLFPGTPVSRKPPHWIVAGELVSTQRTWLRTVAAINPRWVMDAAPHLVRREFLEPAWDHKRGRVSAREVLSLFGMVISAEKRVDYGKVAPQQAREIFIRDALAADRLGADVGFLAHNRALRERLLGWEARLRSRDLYAGERAVTDFYSERLPERVFDRRSLLRWSRGVRGETLNMALEDIATRVPGDDEASQYPVEMELAAHRLPLSYCYDPASDEDGVSVTVPQVLLNAVRPEELDWLVPGWLAEKVTMLLRTLPKPLRRPLVPLPDTASSLLSPLQVLRGEMPLAAAISRVLREVTGVQVDAEAFSVTTLPLHLRMRVIVVDERGHVLGSGRDLLELQRRLAATDTPGGLQPRAPGTHAGRRGDGDRRSPWQRSGVTGWDFGNLPDSVPVAQRGQQVRLYPALVPDRDRVDLTLLPPGPAAEQRHRQGVRRLLLAAIPQQCAWVRDRVRGDRALQLSYHGIGDNNALIDDIAGAAADECFDGDVLIRERALFDQVLQRGRAEFVASAERMLALMTALLNAYRTVRKMLAEGQGISDAARTDIEAQLARLIFPGALSETPAEWRPHLTRYLKAIAMRLEKLAQRHPKDAEHQARVATACARLDAWQANHPPGWPWPPGITRYRWLLEEYRVSLFAQSLGTAVPVSDKRLQEYWDRHVSR
jgi:ATP-dependent helicase HrpA